MGSDIVKQESGIVVDVQALISQGLQSKADIGVMERLFAMAKEADAIRAKRAFFEALAKFQSEMGTITKTKEVKFTNKKGGITNYSYAPLEDIIEAVKVKLKDNCFSYTLKTTQDAASVSVTCEAHHEAGHTEVSPVTVQIDPDAYMSGPQKVGAAITYAKRYAFCNVFGIMTGDEDTDASEPEAKQEKKPDAPEFPKEEHKPSETYKTVFENVKKTFDSMTGTLSKEGAAVAFKDTCKAIWGEKKYYKPIERFTVDELNQFYAQIMTGAK